MNLDGGLTMCCCDGNRPKICDSVTRRACKPHQCSECWRTIAKGERYKAITGFWSSGWETFRWCAHCEAAEEILSREIGGFCWCYSALWEAAREEETDYEDRPRVVSRLIVAARRKWTHRRGARAGRLMPVPTGRVEPCAAGSS